MKIKSAQFVTSAAKLSQCPEADRLEIALVGKSNVGKSSFINALINRKNLARTSSTPGKTQTANFYLINDEFYFVDLPGYGYAKTDKTKKEEFAKIISDYIEKRDADFVVLQLMDFRHAPEKNDVIMYENLKKNGITPVIILTKKDKLKKNDIPKRLNEVIRTLDLDEDTALFTFSVNESDTVAEVSEFLEGLICSI